LKTETIEEWQKRTGKSPQKPKIDYKAKYYYAWITRGKLRLKKKKKVNG
jgi:hypothetical protein